MRTFLTALSLSLATGLIGGCCSPEKAQLEKDYNAPLPPGQYALRKVTDLSQLPDLTMACLDTYALRGAIERSLNYLSKPSSRTFFPSGPFTHEQNVASLQAMLELLNRELSPKQREQEILRRFDFWVSVGCDGEGTVLFTGYYTPIFDASMTKTDRFRYPLYKAPEDLVKLPDGSPSAPMPDRGTIEEDNLYQGNELVWLADPFQVYICHIQGSVRLRMPDGKEITVGYSANNGHPYKGIREPMIRDGVLGKNAGLPSMLRYFESHPEAVPRYTRNNPRFVFFELSGDDAPRGCLNEPVTAMRSIATDKSIFPRAGLTLIDATLPQRMTDGKIRNLPYTGFALDQDAGGAIRAPGRCDVYIGMGDDAGELAGRALSEGRLYYLLLKR